MDLTFVSTDDLIKEIKNRNELCVIATGRTQEGNEPVIDTYWKGNNWIREVGLAHVLLNDVTKDYSNDRSEGD